MSHETAWDPEKHDAVADRIFADAINAAPLNLREATDTMRAHAGNPPTPKVRYVVFQDAAGHEIETIDIAARAGLPADAVAEWLHDRGWRTCENQDCGAMLPCEEAVEVDGYFYCDSCAEEAGDAK